MTLSAILTILAGALSKAFMEVMKDAIFQVLNNPSVVMSTTVQTPLPGVTHTVSGPDLVHKWGRV